MNWRWNVSVSGRKPHLLIDCDPIFAASLWRRCEDAEKPFLLCANPLARSIGDRLTPDQEHYRIGTLLDGLIVETLNVSQNPRLIEEFEHEMDLVRRHFRLAPDEKIRLALAGSHSSISGNLDGSLTHRAFNAERDARTGIENGMRRGRTLAGLVDAAFAKLGMFQPVWLAEAFSELQPPLRPDSYVELAAVARAKVATMRLPPWRDGGTALRQPAFPLIYVSHGAGGPWREMKPPERERPYSVTQKLIAQFGAMRLEDSTLHGVLLKVLPADISRQNVLDAPMVGESTLVEAAKAGIDAIVLDARYGVLRRTEHCRLNETLVFGSLASAGTASP
jgi:hypothetical protein